MDQGYVKEMERLAKEGTVIEIEGKKFSPLNLKPVFYQPRVEAVGVNTLSSLARYLGDNVDGVDLKKIIVQIKSPESVRVMSDINGEDRRRDTFLIAEADGPRFGFGKWMDAESFIIALNAMFVPTENRNILLNFISKLKVENEANLIDDGVSQQASVRVGIKGNLSETAQAPSRLELKPYRTFIEVDQPESVFVFRMRKDDDGVYLSLHEADGGAWRVKAAENIRDWLTAALDNGDGAPSIIY